MKLGRPTTNQNQLNLSTIVNLRPACVKPKYQFGTLSRINLKGNRVLVEGHKHRIKSSIDSPASANNQDDLPEEVRAVT